MSRAPNRRLTMDSSYRAEMRERVSEAKADLRRELDVIRLRLDRIAERLDTLQARLARSARR